MEIKVNEDKTSKMLEDGYADIRIGDYGIYIELNNDGSLWYVELFKKKNGKTDKSYAFDMEMLEKLYPRSPSDPSYWRNDPLCPSCGTYMIYHFEHCPKCGQKIDWSEK